MITNHKMITHHLLVHPSRLKPKMQFISELILLEFKQSINLINCCTGYIQVHWTVRATMPRYIFLLIDHICTEYYTEYWGVFCLVLVTCRLLVRSAFREVRTIWSMFVGSSPQALITSKFLVVLVYMDKYFQIIHMIAKRHKSINHQNFTKKKHI